MAETRSILYKFLADTRGLDKGTRKAERSFGGLKKAALGLGVALGGRELLNFAGDAVQAAISADEAASKFETVFGGSGTASRSMEEFADKAGVATDRSQDLFATLGNLTQAQGFSKDEAAEFAENIGILAGDLASFNDANPEEVFQKLGQAMVTTERESLKPLGISISETEVKQRALAMALEDGRDEASKMDRALASYQIALEQSGMAIGDLDRTADSLANRQRRLTARWRDAQVALGRELLPVMEELISAAEAAIPIFEKLGPVIGGAVREAVRWLNPLGERVEGAGGAFDDLTDVVAGGMALMNDAVVRNIPGINSTLESAIETFDRMGEAERTLKDETFELTTAQARWEDSGNMDGLAGQSDRMADALGRAEQNTSDLTKAVEGQMWIEEEWSRSDALDKVRRRYELLAAAGGVGVDRLTRERSVAQQGGIPTRQTGGMVPGTGPRLIRAHGGERILSRGQVAAGGNGDGGGLTVNIGVVGDPASAADAIVELLDYYERVNGPRPSGLGYGA